MSDTKTSEMRFLPIIGIFMLYPFLRIFLGEFMTGTPYTALDSAFLIPLLPIAVFLVLFLL